MSISIDAEQVFGKIQHPFMIKTLTNLGTEINYLSIIKAMYEKPTANIVFNVEDQKPFLLRSGSRQG